MFPSRTFKIVKFSNERVCKKWAGCGFKFPLLHRHIGYSCRVLNWKGFCIYQKNHQKTAPSVFPMVWESPSIPGRFEWLFGDQTTLLPSFLLPVQWQLVGDLKWDERSQASQRTCEEVFWRPNSGVFWSLSSDHSELGCPVVQDVR